MRFSLAVAVLSLSLVCPGGDYAFAQREPAAASASEDRTASQAPADTDADDWSDHPGNDTGDDWGADWGDDWGDAGSGGMVWSGFFEGAVGGRLQSDDAINRWLTLGEARLRLNTDYQGQRAQVHSKADAWYDWVDDNFHGKFRELVLAFPAGAATDIKLGRQILTWGTGDLLFLNDLFPKDFVSFFAGRDDEYLKAPLDALRVMHFGSLVNLDFVWAPRFEPDRYITGERFSFYSPLADAIVAPRPPLSADKPSSTFSNGEFALRLFRTIDGTEYAAYGYRGYFKQPRALDADFQPAFAALSVYGASLRRPLGSGLFNTEFAWYDSRDDRDGDDALVPNSQLRYLAGYEWEARPRFNVGLQYYLEWIHDHDDLKDNSLSPDVEPDEVRHLLTNRLTLRALRDKLTASLFTFWSPSDQDFYLKPQLDYRHDDRWSWALGANLFGGSHDYTFFGQFQDDSNAFARMRISF